jgi:ABC-2 type transport system permease protein
VTQVLDRAAAAEVAVDPGSDVGFVAGFQAVYAGQLGRGRFARGPLFVVATLQSLGILLLLRGVVDTSSAVTKQSVVAGSTVLVVAFVALNLMAQRLGALRASGALDYYAALPVPPAAVVLGTAASYASFAVPGAILTGIVGALLYGLPLAGLWVLAPVIVLAGAALAGLGAALGLSAPRAELATIAGQLGMTLVLFAGVIPPDRLPGAVQAARAVVPSTYAVDALAEALRSSPNWAAVAAGLAVTAGIAVVSLAVANWAYRRASR